jgi:hypothetical protein
MTPVTLRASFRAAAFLVTLTTISLPTWAQTPSNLLSNGDFSVATTDPTWPDDWGKAKAPGVTWQAEDGKHFLRLTAQAPDKMLMAYREVTIPAGTTHLQVTARYRTNGIVPGSQNWMDARTIFHFLDDNRKPVTPDPGVMDLSRDAGSWTDATETFNVPAGATRLVLMPSLFRVQAGTLDLAQITVTAAP